MSKPCVAAVFMLALTLTVPAGAQHPPSAVQGAATVIRAGALFDGTSGTLRRDVTILVRDGRIVEVGTSVTEPAGAERIDLTGWTVLPGLIDMHTHLTLDPAELMAPPGSFLYGEYPEFAVIRGVAHARATLLAGFTTVRDLGAPGTSALALRDAVERGLVPGPRIIAAIALGTTGSHCDPTTGMRPGHVGLEGARPWVFDGPDQAAAMVRRAVRDGADLIKVCATAGVLSISDDIGPAQMTGAELEAVVGTARTLNRRVAAHAHGLEGIHNAVRAGITTIDHGSILDDAVIREMKQRSTWLVPTMMAFEGIGEMARAGQLPPGPTQKTFAIEQHVLGSHRRAFAAGVPVAFGTDAGVFEHGRNAREFLLMVGAGMSAADALLSATRNAAAALGRDDIGAVIAGRRADIIAVRSDPLQDVAVLQDVGFVMKDGVVYKQDGRITDRGAAATAGTQLPQR